MPDEIKPKPLDEAPLSSEEFTAAMEALIARARAAGVRPLQVMAATYVKQGMDMIDGLLGALEDSSNARAKPLPKPEKKEEA